MPVSLSILRTYTVLSNEHNGASPSGKATGFDPVIGGSIPSAPANSRKDNDMTDDKSVKIKAKILQVGIDNWPDVNARAIGRKLLMHHTNILYYFGDVEKLRNAVAAEAVRIGNSRVIVQLMMEKHSAVAALSEDDQQKHWRAMAGMK